MQQFLGKINLKIFFKIIFKNFKKYVDKEKMKVYNEENEGGILSERKNK